MMEKNKKTKKIKKEFTLGVVGVGLIGGSFALAMKRAEKGGGGGCRAIGFDRSRETLARAESLGVIDAIADDFSAVGECDFILVAAPVLACEEIFSALANHLHPDSILLDAASVKGEIVRAAHRQLGKKIARFVPCHPIAGAEFSGVESARANLFEGREAIICAEHSDSDAIEKVESLWRFAGARLCRMDADFHDRIFGAVSHLPHALAFAIVNAVGRNEKRDTLLRFAASGFRDFTRIASSHPEMWRDICIANRENILNAMNDYRGRLDALQSAIESADGESLLEQFDFARRLRNDWLKTLEK